jgi:hypothetical protein
MMTKPLSALVSEIYNGRVEDIAHVLIFYEVRDPTIADTISKLATRLNSFSIDIKYKAKFFEAVLIRRKRLGDALWFSRN